MLPWSVSPFLRAFGGRTGDWFPRVGDQEGPPTSAASSLEDRRILVVFGENSSGAFVIAPMRRRTMTKKEGDP